MWIRFSWAFGIVLASVSMSGCLKEQLLDYYGDASEDVIDACLEVGFEDHKNPDGTVYSAQYLTQLCIESAESAESVERCSELGLGNLALQCIVNSRPMIDRCLSLYGNVLGQGALDSFLTCTLFAQGSVEILDACADVFADPDAAVACTFWALDAGMLKACSQVTTQETEVFSCTTSGADPARVEACSKFLPQDGFEGVYSCLIVSSQQASIPVIEACAAEVEYSLQARLMCVMGASSADRVRICGTISHQNDDEFQACVASGSVTERKASRMSAPARMAVPSRVVESCRTEDLKSVLAARRCGQQLRSALR